MNHGNMARVMQHYSWNPLGVIVIKVKPVSMVFLQSYSAVLLVGVGYKKSELRVELNQSCGFIKQGQSLFISRFL